MSEDKEYLTIEDVGRGYIVGVVGGGIAGAATGHNPAGSAPLGGFLTGTARISYETYKRADGDTAREKASNAVDEFSELF